MAGNLYTSEIGHFEFIRNNLDTTPNWQSYFSHFAAFHNKPQGQQLDISAITNLMNNSMRYGNNRDIENLFLRML